VYNLFEEENPSIVVNFSAENHVDRSIEDHGVFLKTNSPYFSSKSVAELLVIAYS